MMSEPGKIESNYPVGQPDAHTADEIHDEGKKEKTPGQANMQDPRLYVDHRD